MNKNKYSKIKLNCAWTILFLTFAFSPLAFAQMNSAAIQAFEANQRANAQMLSEENQRALEKLNQVGRAQFGPALASLQELEQQQVMIKIERCLRADLPPNFCNQLANPEWIK